MSFISLPLRRILTIAMSSGLLLSVWTPARAEMSAWADNEGGRMRLIALPPDASGTIRAGLQIEPKPGWVTYWREPGNSGIPPQITFPPETGIVLDRMEYPVPRHIADGKVDEVVYDAPVTFPLQLSVKNAAAGEIKADAFIGICKDICVPFQARFALKLSPVPQSRPQEEAILAAADARLPETPSSEFEVTKYAFSDDMRELTLRVALPEPGETTPVVIVTGPGGHVFTRQLSSKRDGAVFTTTISIGKLPTNYDAAGNTWSALVIDGTRAIETPLAFE
jgi:DsbC/DsbD-like thiol-disulfide interchange protein